MALYRDYGDKNELAHALSWLGMALWNGGDYEQAAALHEESFDLSLVGFSDDELSSLAANGIRYAFR